MVFRPEMFLQRLVSSWLEGPVSVVSEADSGSRGCLTYVKFIWAVGTSNGIYYIFG